MTPLPQRSPFHMLGKVPPLPHEGAPSPTMIRQRFLTSMYRRSGPIFIGFLGVVRLGKTESVTGTAGGRAP
jgi:hypothetical protein